ncbi:TaqI-like C-terminal specificity domain-containing protein [uncultured Fibrobacter sp.]|jgi:type I restriction-modification system DNA methylase subunit|uniref:TaqI-like C-terminal specificity domain-containing protein n=1 Tax=uncultured Fibrobacter sp. TaxID=261512 RepID=UPI0025F1942B|nr:TaqI-like C-terminal specificity domain-containing protein [uncultured Fibrobacter sp.]
MQLDLFDDNIVQTKGRSKKHSENVTNRTATNRHKMTRLKEEHVLPMHNIKNKKETCDFLKYTLTLTSIYNVPQIIFSLSKALLGYELKEYRHFNSPCNIEIPENIRDEFDLIGSVYQYLTPKYNRLNQGSFYTSQDMIEQIISSVRILPNETIFDPSCGSGNLLFNSKTTKPSQIYGIDTDPIAILCCKTNYYLKFGEKAPSPNIFCQDFIQFIKSNKRQFDYVICNPPFGATINISQMSENTVATEDSLTYFVEHCATISSNKSLFILPESVINVKKHDVLRKWLLNNTNIYRIDSYGANFSGTMFPIVVLCIDNKGNNQDHFLFDNKKVSKKATAKMPFYYFRPIDEEDSKIIDKVFKRKAQSLKGSVFALGVVTGGNKDKLFDKKVDGAEPIITGKDIHKFTISKPQKWLKFDRKNLQQVAPTELYRAKEKLLYKVVSREMIFAIDYEGRLTLNSANFVIPKNLTISTKCLMGLFNSDLYNRLNKMLYGENKISKTNLENLPLPSLSKQQQQKMEHLIDTHKYKELDEFVYKIFEL